MPWACDFQGEALFIDADVLVMDDVSKLFMIPWEDHSIRVVQNKLRFEWPSVILFKNDRCKMLTPEYIEQNNCNDLHWANIGELPKEWNYLVGYEESCGRPENPSIAHFTQGLPCFAETKNTLHKEWEACRQHANSTVSWESIMGQSVHKKAMGL